MANDNLTGQTIASTYNQLLITADTGGITGADASATQIHCGGATAGADNADTTPLYLSTTRVGIGSAAPDHRLTVYSTDNDALALRATTTYSSGASGPEIQFEGRCSDGTIRAALAMIRATSTGSNAGELRFGTRVGGTCSDKMTLDLNGYLGIGTIDPATKLHVVGEADVTGLTISSFSTNDTHSGIIYFKKSGHASEGSYTATADDEMLGDIRFYGADTGPSESRNAAWISCSQDGAAGGTDVPTRLVFGTGTDSAAATERMRIDSSGNVGIGEVAPAELLEVSGTSNAYIQINGDSDGADANNAGIKLAEAGTAKWTIFNNGGATDRLDIKDAGGDDGVYIAQDGDAWADLSDERLKHSFSPIENAVDKLNTLQAVNFKWKYGSEKRKVRNNLGLIAQEVNEVFPEAVDSPDLKSFKLNDHPLFDGEKQADNAWGIAYSKIVPVLVKAIQELSAKVDALENNNEQGDSSNEQEQESAGSGDSGGDASSESSGEDSGGVSADSSDSSASEESASGESESSSSGGESGASDGDESSGGSGSGSSDDSEGENGEVDSGGEGEPSDEWTKDQLKAYMDDNSISYNSGDTKDDLLLKISVAGD